MESTQVCFTVDMVGNFAACSVLFEVVRASLQRGGGAWAFTSEIVRTCYP